MSAALPRKVLHLITRLDAGGSSENVLLSARGAMARGLDALVASGPSARPSVEALSGDVPCRILPALTREIHPFKDAAALSQISGLLRSWKPDVLHTHTSKAGILGRWAAALCPAPRPKVVHTPHGHVFYGYFPRWKSSLFILLERLAAKRTDVLVALSRGELRESLERGVGRPEQWTVVPSGIAFRPPSLDRAQARRALKAASGIAEDALVVGSVARLEPVKGVRTMLEAASKVPARCGASPVAFVLVGDGGLAGELRARARALGLADRMFFAGHQGDVPAWLAGMDVYVQPSWNEGMGKALVQAQALGLPVVASRVCGIPDVVREGLSGLLVEPGDAGALAEAVSRLLLDEGLRERLGAGARSWALREDETGFPAFSDAAMLERLMPLYLR